MSMHVIWTETGREEYIKGLLERSIGKDHPGVLEDIYVPGRIKLFRSSGGVIEEEKPLFPGYLFIETPDLKFVMEELRQLHFDTFIQILGKKSETMRDVSEEEKQRIYHMCGKDHLMGISKAVKEGTRVRFISGPMLGMEAYVKKVEPRKCVAVLEMELFGEKRRIAAAFETFLPDEKTLVYGRGEEKKKGLT